jgi:hypothetical protein
VVLDTAYDLELIARAWGAHGICTLDNEQLVLVRAQSIGPDEDSLEAATSQVFDRARTILAVQHHQCSSLAATHGADNRTRVSSVLEQERRPEAVWPVRGAKVTPRKVEQLAVARGAG